MRNIMMAAMAAATLALAGASASAAGSQGARLSTVPATPIDLAQYYGGGGYGGGGYGGGGYQQYCRRVCVARDYYGNCTHFRRVCH